MSLNFCYFNPYHDLFLNLNLSNFGCSLKQNIHDYVINSSVNIFTTSLNVFTVFIVYCRMYSKSDILRLPSVQQSHISLHSSVHHLFAGEILVSSCEKLCHEGLYGPHHGAETIGAEQHSWAHPTSTARHIMACPARPVATLPAPAKTHRSSAGPRGRLAASGESAV